MLWSWVCGGGKPVGSAKTSLTVASSSSRRDALSASTVARSAGTKGQDTPATKVPDDGPQLAEPPGTKDDVVPGQRHDVEIGQKCLAIDV